MVWPNKATPILSLVKPRSYRVKNEDFETEHKIVEMYINSAKSYIQMSTGALALAAVFAPGNMNELGGWLLASCVFFLIAVLSGGAYHSLAVGRLERLSGLPIERGRPIPDSCYENSYVWYNILLLAFHIGALLLALVILFKIGH